MAARKPSTEVQMENLRRLKNRLVKQAMEDRVQNKKLRSELFLMALDHYIFNETEREVFRLVVSYRFSEELQYSLYEMDFSERCSKDNKQLVEKLVTKMVLMKIQEGVDLDVLKTDNDGNGSKIFALEEERCFEQKRNMSELRRLEKEKIELEKKFDLKEKETALQINELKRNMIKMAVEKDLVDQTNAKYVIQISNLEAKISELQSARKSHQDAINTCNEKLAVKEPGAMIWREKMNQTVSQKKLNHHLTMESEETKKHINYLIEDTRKHINSLVVDRASLAKQLEISIKRLWDIQKRLKTSEYASGQVFYLLEKMTAAIMDAKRIPVNYNSIERGLEIQNYEEMKLFAKYEIQISNMEAEISELQSARMSLEDAHSTCGEKIAVKEARHTEMERKMNQSEAQKTQLLKKLNHLTTENEDTEKHINSLILDKASLVKQLEDKEAKIKNLNQELELLQVSVACGENKWGIWKWLFAAATTIFGVGSFAYAAKAGKVPYCMT